MIFDELNKSILIIGGTGFLGSRVLNKAIEHSNDMHLLVRPSANFERIEPLFPDINIHYGDLTDLKSLQTIINKINPAFVFYCAGAGTYKNKDDRDILFKNNLLSTNNFLMATEPLPNCRIVYAGTSLEQGKVLSPMIEDAASNPISCYGAMKTAANILMMQAAQYEKRKITVLNPFYMYGVGEPSTRLISTAIIAGLTNQAINLTSEDYVRDLINVDDVANAFLLSAVTPESIGYKINIAGGKGISNMEIINEIEKLLNVTIRKKIGAFQARSTDSKFWSADISKAKKILSWKPQISLDQGLKLMIESLSNSNFIVSKK